MVWLDEIEPALLRVSRRMDAHHYWVKLINKTTLVQVCVPHTVVKPNGSSGQRRVYLVLVSSGLSFRVGYNVVGR